ALLEASDLLGGHDTVGQLAYTIGRERLHLQRRDAPVRAQRRGHPFLQEEIGGALLGGQLQQFIQLHRFLPECSLQFRPPRQAGGPPSRLPPGADSRISAAPRILLRTSVLRSLSPRPPPVASPPPLIATHHPRSHACQSSAAWAAGGQRRTVRC